MGFYSACLDLQFRSAVRHHIAGSVKNHDIYQRKHDYVDDGGTFKAHNVAAAYSGAIMFAFFSLSLGASGADVTILVVVSAASGLLIFSSVYILSILFLILVTSSPDS